MTSGWTCPSCGVNYAPSVTKCECSAVDVEQEMDAERLRQILDDWQKNQPPVVPAPPVFVPVPWVDPMDYWRQPSWWQQQWCGGVVVTTPTADIRHVDYLRLSRLEGSR